MKQEKNDNTPRIGTRGRTFVGTVIAANMTKTATIEWGRRRFIPKFERYEKRRTKIKAHNPDSIGAVAGDKVRIEECRPLSKTKKFIIVEKL
jgi:small subunit ribosomal protein S17